MVDSAKPRFTCTKCEKSFSRAEHLTRHSVLHDGTQSYACELCNKSFPRKDALNRHVTTHDGGPNLLERKARACRACAKAKVRCNGEKPCSRCASRSIDCVFPEPRPHHSHSNEDMLPSPTSDSASAPDGMAVLTGHPESAPVHRAHRESIAYSQVSGPLTASPEVSMDVFPHEHRPSVSTQAGQAQSHRFDPNYWSPAMLSSINWLPIDSSPNFSHSDLMSPLPMIQSPAFDHHVPHPVHLDHMGAISNNGSATHTGSPADDSLASRSVTSGDHYIERNGSRLPRIKRQKIIARRPSELQSRNFGWRLFWLPPIAQDEPIGRHFADFEYQDMHNAFLTLCVDCAPVMTPFINTEFPPIEAFDHLMHLFFKHVHPSIPFVHRPTFNPDHEGRWVLLLSMVCTSCWFLDDESLDDFAESMLEFCRRVTLYFDSSNMWQKTFTNCRQAQIRLLFMMASSASRHEATKMWSDRCMSELAYIVNTAICQSYPRACYTHAGMPTNAEWIDWSECEQTRRTAFLVWQVGLLRSMQDPSGRAPVTLDSVSPIRLPCTDDVFEAPDAESWQALYSKYSLNTFQEALQNLYIEKRLIPALGDLSHTLLIYGVIQRTREVEDLVKQPLSLIEPSAEKRRSSEVAMQTVWPPGIPQYAKWRNSACDCFDLLHWPANTHTGMSSGVEPAKVIHLHFARILMLVPLHDLLSLARLVNFPFRSSVDTGMIPPEEIGLKRSIQRWAISDQYKARLAAIHAGVTFWHLRRFSTNAHYEPFAALGATLTLWALSMFTPRMSITGSSPDDVNGHDGQDGKDDTYNIILIDRPTDEELVQQFVRQGQSMRVHMSGVDNLWSPTAPYKVLSEGKKLLATLGAWPGETERALGLLDGLMMTGAREM